LKQGGKGLNIMLQAFPLDGKIVCREIADGDEAEEPVSSSRPKQNNAGCSAPAAHRR